jgi:outer membrane lipoprotein SlyB
MAAVVMRDIQMKKFVLLPVVLAVGLSACASNGVQPGIVNGSSNGGSSNGGGYQNASAPASMGTGRVVSINEVALAGGGGGSGMNSGTTSGGLIGGAGGAALGAVVGRGSLGGILIGGLLGAVGGAVAGTVYHGHSGSGRGIEVTVQREDGATMKVAQRDEGDIQLGDRVEIVQDSRGVAKAVRDNSRAPDTSPPYASNGSQYNGPQYNGPSNGPQYNGPSNGPQYNGPPSNDPRDYAPPVQDMRSSSNQQYVPRGQDYQAPQDSQRYSQSRAPRPQDDPRYGNLD